GFLHLRRVKGRGYNGGVRCAGKQLRRGVMNIVSVGAHQDDEGPCLGTLIRCARRGDHITIISISNGDKGGQFDPSISHERIAELRIQEATEVAQALGGEYYCLGQEDEYIQDNRAARDALTK